ncbi:hypothetical protein ACQW5G_01805 [Fructilactobacillus sp. Tb1]|uniref:hypothetical protein n=1 Tax=Fructilactobacillus sp. Tb1 TaxID=3422304 RepID=UPI003D2CE98E
MDKQTIEVSLNKGILKNMQMLADAKQISVAEEIENILNQHFAKPALIGMPDLVGTEINGSQLQADGLTKVNGSLYFYEVVGRQDRHATYVIADVSEQKLYLVEKGAYYAWN